MSNKAYITDIARFLPNEPVTNDQIEGILGKVNCKPSRTRKLILRNNQIKTRYYAIDPATGTYTHTNAQMSAEAVRAVAKQAGFDLNDLELLCAGTTGPDLGQPAHGFMIHGELESPPCEVFTAQAVCSSSMYAMKYAMLNIANGMRDNAISVGSEFSSRYMRGRNFEPEVESRLAHLEKHPELGFEKDFLRWMLSDGAGAAMLSSKPKDDGISLQIDWIDMLSYANELPVCMYSGGLKDDDGTMHYWQDLEDPLDLVRKNYHMLKQDARLLNEHMMVASVDKALVTIAKRRNLDSKDVDWFLPHYSSEYFRPRLNERMVACGLEVPQEKWFTNLHQVGNVGAASIYLILEEFMRSGKPKKGDRILCYIPESARFNVCYMHLTVV